jgi:hypothetical protein
MTHPLTTTLHGRLLLKAAGAAGYTLNLRVNPHLSDNQRYEVRVAGMTVMLSKAGRFSRYYGSGCIWPTNEVAGLLSAVENILCNDPGGRKLPSERNVILAKWGLRHEQFNSWTDEAITARELLTILEEYVAKLEGCEEATA